MSHRNRKTAKPADGKRAAKIAAAPPVMPQHRLGRADLDRAPVLLGRLAEALNDCDRAGVFVQLAHGAVITDAGYVLRVQEPGSVMRAGETWVVRTRTLTEFPPAPSPDGIDD